MLGRKIIPIKKVISINLLIVLASSLSGCQNDSINIQKKQRIDFTNISVTDTKNYFNLEENEKKNITDITVSDNSLFDGSTNYSYPSDVDFVPTFLSNQNILYGEADSSDDRSELFLASYDLNTGTFSKLKDIDMNSEYSAIGIVTATTNFVVYEENNQQKNLSVYHLYDIGEKKDSVLFTIDNIPQIHYTQAFANEKGIMINFYSDDGYENKFFSYETKTLINIEDKNCGYPVFYQGYWYYISIDNENSKTELIKFDMQNGTKEIIYKTEESNKYLSGLYSNGDKLFLTLRTDDMNKFYKVDIEEKNINYIFESDWIESVIMNKNHMSWLGSNTLEERNRPQYYLFNLDEYNQEINKDGMIFLSDSGIARIKYKKSDTEILKGEMFTDMNTSIEFKSIK